MIGEAPLLLQMEDEGPDFMITDLGYICAYSLRSEEIEKVTYAVGDDANGIGTLPFGSSAKLITLK